MKEYRNMKNEQRRSPGRPRIDRNKSTTKNEILKTATMMFLNLGYEGVSIEGVARECQVTKATVYYYYKNKADLFFSALIQMLDHMEQSIKQFLKTENDLRNILIGLAKAHLEPTHHMNLEGLMAQAERFIPDEQMQKLREGTERVILSIADSFTKAVENEEIRPVDPNIAAYAYNSLLLMGNIKHPDGTPLFKTPSEAAEQIVDLFWEGLRIQIDSCK